MPVLIVIFCLFINSTCIEASAYSDVKKGNKFYNNSQFNEALDHYNKAQIDRPNQSDINYNLGAALYKQKQYNEAIDRFSQVITNNDTALQSKALYNIGNSYFQMGNLENALTHYKRALDKDPNDIDTKFNIEFTEKKIKEMKSKAKETQKKAEQDRKKQDPSQNEGGQSPTSKTKEKEESDSTQSQAQNQNQGEDEKNNQNETENDSQEKAQEQQGISKEEAEQFLNEFDQSQKRDILKQYNQDNPKGRAHHVEKPW